MEDVLDTSISRFKETGLHLWSKYERWKADGREGEKIATNVLEQLDAKRRWEDTTRHLKSHLAVMNDHAVALQAEPRFWRKWSEGREDDNQGKGDDIARDAPEELQANGSWRETGQALTNHLAAMKAQAIAVKAGLGEHNLKVNLSVDTLREWKDRVMESLPEFDEVVEPKNGTTKAVTDVIATRLIVVVS